MDSIALKEAIAADVETLKTLDLPIMPAREYYRLNFLLMRHVFLKIYFTVLLTIVIPYVYHCYPLATAPELLEAIGFFVLFVFGLSLLFCLFLLSTLNQYVIVKHQLRTRLLTGDLIVDRIRFAGHVAYGIFTTIVVISPLFVQPAYVLGVAIGAFLISAALTGMVVEMELTRVGVSTLFALIRRFFDKNAATVQVKE